MDEEKLRWFARRLGANRSRRGTSPSNCTINENARYLGGARGTHVRGIVEQCLAADVGMAQMPCPEQRAWDGVAKRPLMEAYGTRGTLPHCLRCLLPVLLACTGFVYRRKARGATVGNRHHLYAVSTTVEEMNAIVRRDLTGGTGPIATGLEEGTSGAPRSRALLGARLDLRTRRHAFRRGPRQHRGIGMTRIDYKEDAGPAGLISPTRSSGFGCLLEIEREAKVG